MLYLTDIQIEVILEVGNITNDKRSNKMPRERFKQHGVQIYMEEVLKRWLEKEAVAQFCSVSQVVRNLITDKIKKQEEGE